MARLALSKSSLQKERKKLSEDPEIREEIMG